MLNLHPIRKYRELIRERDKLIQERDQLLKDMDELILEREAPEYTIIDELECDDPNTRIYRLFHAGGCDA